MDYNKLKTFVVTVDSGTLTAAARSLLRSQSAISQQIQLLEEELGLRLFERKGGRVYLSSDGEAIYRLAKEQMERIDSGVLKVKKQITSVEGHIRLGALNDNGTDFDIGTVVGNFCAKYPAVSISLHTGTSESLENDLIANKLDLAIFVVFRAPELFIQTPIVTSYHSLYTSKKYLASHGPFDSFEKIIAADLVDISDEFLGLGAFVRKNAKTLIGGLKHRKPNIVAPNLASVRDILLTGFGVAMLPDFLALKDLRARRLVKLMPEAKNLSGRLDIAYRTNHTLRFCERLFIESVVK